MNFKRLEIEKNSKFDDENDEDSIDEGKETGFFRFLLLKSLCLYFKRRQFRNKNIQSESNLKISTYV